MNRKQVQRLAGLLLHRRLDFKSDGVVFQRAGLSRRKIRNLLLAHLEARLRLTRPFCYPVGLQLEPTFACQLRCRLCPRHHAQSGPAGGGMCWQGYQKLMKEVGPHLLAIALWRFGEPFLHPRLIDMVALAHSYGVLTSISTNGQFDPDKVHLRDLLDAGLDHLIISTDGATQETYEQFRAGGSLERLKNFIRAAVSVKRALGRRTPVINVRTIATRQNEAEIEEIASFARMVGADVFSVKSLYLIENATPLNPDLPVRCELRSLQYRSQEGAEAYGKLPNLCRKPWTWPTVCYDGTLLVCECDQVQERVVGNVFTEPSFASLWRGQRYQHFRANFPVRGRIDAEFCRKCRYKLDDNTLAVRTYSKSG